MSSSSSFLKKPLYSSKDVAKSRPQDAFLPLSFTFPLGGISRWRERKTLQQSPPPPVHTKSPSFLCGRMGERERCQEKRLTNKNHSLFLSLVGRARPGNSSAFLTWMRNSANSSCRRRLSLKENHGPPTQMTKLRKWIEREEEDGDGFSFLIFSFRLP